MKQKNQGQKKRNWRTSLLMIAAVVLGVGIEIAGWMQTDYEFAGRVGEILVAMAAEADTQTEVFDKGLAVSTYNNGKAYQDWWGESEVCVYVENIEQKLTRGAYGVSVYIPDYELKDGAYAVEISICTERNPYTLLLYSGKEFRISNGVLVENNDLNIRRTKAGNFIDMLDWYCFEQPVENYVFVVKLHSDVSGANGNLYLGDFFLADFNGTWKEAQGDASVKYSAEHLQTGKKHKIEWINFTAQPEVTNMEGLLYTGETLKVKTKGYSKSTDLKYATSNKNVATITKYGTITAKKVGTTKITVTDKKTGASFAWNLTVKAPYVAPVFEKNAIMLGDTYMFTAQAYGLKETQFVWSSSKKTVGTINAKTGVFKAKKAGTTKITLLDKISQKKCTFDVKVYAVDKAKVKNYISVETNGLISAELEKKVTELLCEVYPEVFDYFANGKYDKITCTFAKTDGVAYTTGRDIVVNADYINENPNDLDCITHELIHCAQYYPGYDSVWLVEGITDYGRALFGLYNDKADWQLTEYEEWQHYTNSYSVTGGFLKYVVQEHNKDMVYILNDSFKADNYSETLWKTYTGYTIDELWEMYAKH